MYAWIKHLLVATVTVILISAVLLLPTSIENGKPFKRVGGRDRIYFENALKETPPEVVLVGNSLLRDGVDETLLSEQTGFQIVKLARGGTASAAWYLTIKNVVLKFRVKPRYVLVFFRDTFLTNPTYRVTGRYRRFIDSLRGEDEKVLQELAYGASNVDLMLERFVPAYRRREEVKEAMDSFLKDSVVAGVLGMRKGKVGHAIDRVFDEKNLDDEILTKQQLDAEAVMEKEAYSFEDRVDNSFLPYIIKETREAGVQLILVRFKTRRHLVPNSEMQELRQYIGKLNKYLADEKIPLLDFAREPMILEKHFATGDHLNRKNGRLVFTKLLAQRLKSLLKKKK